MALRIAIVGTASLLLPNHLERLPFVGDANEYTLQLVVRALCNSLYGANKPTTE